MTISLALLIITILLVYDYFFMRMLLGRKGRTLFSIDIEEGKIKHQQGKINPGFIRELEIICAAFRPGKIKIYQIKGEAEKELKLSGVYDEELKAAIFKAYQNWTGQIN